MWGRTAQGRKKRGWMGSAGGGGGSIVVMWKQSNADSNHSRGTAGAHRDSSLGGPRVSGEREGVSLQET